VTSKRGGRKGETMGRKGQVSRGSLYPKVIERRKGAKLSGTVYREEGRRQKAQKGLWGKGQSGGQKL